MFVLNKKPNDSNFIHRLGHRPVDHTILCHCIVCNVFIFCCLTAFLLSVRIRPDRGFSSLFGRPLLNDDLFFAALVFALLLVRLLAVAVRIIGRQSIASSFISSSGGSPTATTHFRFVIGVQQRKKVTKLFLL